MSRGPATFKERDLTRAVRAVLKAGLEVARVTVDIGGQITVIVGHGSGEVAAERNEGNPWDEVLEHGRH